jgi:F-type H+-transporting ATPase subunit b
MMTLVSKFVRCTGAASVAVAMALWLGAIEAPQGAWAQHDEAGGAAHPEEAGHDAAGGHGPSATPNPLETSIDLAIFTGLVFLLLMIVLGKFAWRPIAQALDDREKRIADNIAAAENSLVEGKRLLGEYEKKLEGAQNEVRAIIDEARRDAEHTQQEILAHARDDAQKEMERAHREIDTATAQALKEISERSASLAVELAGKILRQKLSAEEQSRLVREALASIPQGDHRNN